MERGRLVQSFYMAARDPLRIITLAKLGLPLLPGAADQAG